MFRADCSQMRLPDYPCAASNASCLVYIGAILVHRYGYETANGLKFVFKHPNFRSVPYHLAGAQIKEK